MTAAFDSFMRKRCAVDSGLPTKLDWVNHASFVYERGAVRLICDPWLTGTAFNHGWRHLSETQFRPEDFSRITHIWVSHQHPDHFAPQDLKAIPADVRARIPVLYQTVPDKLVVSWLRSAGFKDVRELQMEQWIRLSDSVEIMCGALSDDSWLALRTASETILNVNDCVLKRRDHITHIRELVGQIDVLLTQFSYAQWVGNPGDVWQRKADAREKLERIRLQCEIFDPKTVIPFASFVYFSNTENFYLNDAMNRVGEVADFIERDLARGAVVLYPGESWAVDAPHDWHAAAARYDEDAQAKVASGPQDAPLATEARALQHYVEQFLRRLRAKNPASRWLVKERASVFLTDHGRAYRLSINGMEPISADPNGVEIVTSSENILYAFRTPWGGNTLHVSGRFESHIPGGHLRFFRLLTKVHY
jgi:UDP-MurNAc hydroxylase